jgi:hypothetical protein
MIKNLLSNKIVSAASGECVVISLKLADAEGHLIRLFALLLLVASSATLIFDWHQKATDESASTAKIPVVYATKTGKNTRKSRTRR